MSVYRHVVFCEDEIVGEFFYTESFNEVGVAYRIVVHKDDGIAAELSLACLVVERVPALKVDPFDLPALEGSDMFFPVERSEVLPPYGETVLYYEQKLTGLHIEAVVVGAHRGGTSRANAIFELPMSPIDEDDFTEFRNGVLKSKDMLRKEVVSMIKRKEKRAKKC